MARIYSQAAQTAASGSPLTAYSSRTSVSVSVTAGKRYAIFWSAIMSHSALTSRARVRLQNVTNGVTLQQFEFEPQDLTDRMSAVDVNVFTASSTTTIEFAIQWSASAGTATISDAYINVLELDDADVSSYDSTQIATTNAVATPIDSINIPAGEWFVFGSCNVNTPRTAQAADDMVVQLSDGTNTYMVRTQYYAKDTLGITPYFAIVTASLGATTTFSLEHSSPNGQNIVNQYRTLLALDRSKFAETYAAVSESAQIDSTSAGAPTAIITYTPTIANTGNHLVVGTWTTKISATNSSVFSHFGTSTTEPGQYSATGRQPLREASVSNIDEFAHGWSDVESLTAGSITKVIAWRPEANVNATISDAAIVILSSFKKFLKFSNDWATLTIKSLTTSLFMS